MGFIVTSLLGFNEKFRNLSEKQLLSRLGSHLRATASLRVFLPGTILGSMWHLIYTFLIHAMLLCDVDIIERDVTIKL